MPAGGHAFGNGTAHPPARQPQPRRGVGGRAGQRCRPLGASGPAAPTDSLRPLPQIARHPEPFRTRAACTGGVGGAAGQPARASRRRRAWTPPPPPPANRPPPATAEPAFGVLALFDATPSRAGASTPHTACACPGWAPCARQSPAPLHPSAGPALANTPGVQRKTGFRGGGRGGGGGRGARQREAPGAPPPTLALGQSVHAVLLGVAQVHLTAARGGLRNGVRAHGCRAAARRVQPAPPRAASNPCRHPHHRPPRQFAWAAGSAGSIRVPAASSSTARNAGCTASAGDGEAGLAPLGEEMGRWTSPGALQAARRPRASGRRRIV